MVASVRGPLLTMMGKPFGVPILPFVMVFGGCMSSLVFMEYVLKGDPNAGNFINATEFVFVLLQSIPSRVQPGTWKLRPLRASWMSHLQHALLWVSMSTLANYVFAFNISIPIHTLFRSCNMIASLALGLLFFGCRYSFRQVCCVLIITVGIFLASIGDSQRFSAAPAPCQDCATAAPAPATGGLQVSATPEAELRRWCTGIALLVLAQCLQATLGHTQAVFYRRFSDRGTRDQLADEYLFTAHVASLLMILALWEDISTSAVLAWKSPVLCEAIPIPRRLLWMVLNNFTQLACIKGVFRLAANFPPLAVTIVLSVRKFLSLILSAVWFGNPWTHLHSVAVPLIFGGVVLYCRCPPPPAESAPAKKAD